MFREMRLTLSKHLCQAIYNWMRAALREAEADLARDHDTDSGVLDANLYEALCRKAIRMPCDIGYVRVQQVA
jgi:hypothetical protein